MNIKIVIATLLVVSLWGCKSESKTNHDIPLVLFDFEHGFDPDKVEKKRMDVSLISEEGNKSLLLHSHPEKGSASFVLQKPEGVDMPILIGEYHFGALDRGLFHVGIKSATSQENRGECFQHYVESALARPHIVGTHWFQYGDQAVTGRGDGENYNVGLVSIGDIPFPELISAIRRTSYPLFEYRSREAASIASEQ